MAQGSANRLRLPDLRRSGPSHHVSGARVASHHHCRDPHRLAHRRTSRASVAGCGSRGRASGGAPVDVVRRGEYAQERANAGGAAERSGSGCAARASARARRARLLRRQRRDAHTQLVSASAASRVQPGRDPADRLAQAAAHLRFSPHHARRAAQVCAGAARAQHHRDDDALRAPQPGRAAGCGEVAGRARPVEVRRGVSATPRGRRYRAS